MATIGRRYLRLLRTHTLLTQMATSGVVFALGDCLSQQVIEKKPFREHNINRTGRFLIYGAFLWAPVANRWHTILNKIELQSFPATVVTRVAIDMGLFAPVAVAYFFAGMGILESRTLLDIRSRIEQNWLPVYQNSVMVFGPTQIINMSLIPVYARPPFMNIVSLGWNCYIATYNQRTASSVRSHDAQLDIAAKAIV